MFSQPTPRDVTLKIADADLTYGLAAFAGSYTSSYVGNALGIYQGKAYEFLGFLSGGVATTLAYHFFDLLRGYTQSQISNSCKKTLVITARAAVINYIYELIDPQNSHVQKTMSSFGISIIIPIVYRIVSG